jgi:myo-inositol 2-dehydrogenase / D-chiro-inositol 1-dehydrogenase
LTRALESTKVDGLVVSSPTFTHESIIREAGRQGVSVFVEKPVDETADKISDLFQFATKSGIHLCCGFQRRFDASYVAATQAVQQGAIGKPSYVNLFFADHPVPHREFMLKGGNIFMDLAVHDIDYITHTLQDTVESVSARGTSSDEELAAAGVHDNAIIVMHFSKGTIGTLFLSRSAVYGYDQRCEMFGPLGLVSIGNPKEHAMVLSNTSGIHQSRLHHSFPQRFNEAFAKEMDAYAGTLLSGQAWPITGEDCIRAQRITDAACLSAKTGETVLV